MCSKIVYNKNVTLVCHIIYIENEFWENNPLCHCYVEACKIPKWGPNCGNFCNCSGRGAKQCDTVRGCICTTGWKGDNCDTDIDECKEDLNICQDSKTVCTNTVGSYVCSCISGYKKAANGSCLGMLMNLLTSVPVLIEHWL